MNWCAFAVRKQEYMQIGNTYSQSFLSTAKVDQEITTEYATVIS